MSRLRIGIVHARRFVAHSTRSAAVRGAQVRSNTQPRGSRQRKARWLPLGADSTGLREIDMGKIATHSDGDKRSILDAERAVCSILLAWPDRIAGVLAGGACAAWFHEPKYQAVWSALEADHRAQLRPDFATVHARMTEQRTIGCITTTGSDPIDWIIELATEMHGPGGLDGYLRTVHRGYIERQSGIIRADLQRDTLPADTRQRLGVELRELTANRDAILSHADGWPEPLPLPAESDTVPRLTPDMLPPSLRGWLHDVAERMQCPSEFPAIAALVTVASLIGRRLAIRPKRRDDWTEMGNLWGLIIGPPGILKTPAIEAAIEPIHRLEQEAREQYAREHEGDETNDKVARAQIKGLEARIARDTQQDPDANVEELREKLRDLQSSTTPMRRYVTHDATIEKLSVLLRDNPRGLLLYDDEIMGWLRSMDRDGHEGDRTFYLKAWSGKGLHSADRMCREVAPHPICVSVFGGIQPGPLASYIRAAASDQEGADGFIQRFQLAVWPQLSEDFEFIDRWPDQAAHDRACEVFRRVDLFEPIELGASQDGELWFLRFADDAQGVFSSWFKRLEQRLRQRNGMHPALQAHLSKYRGLCPRLALLFHVVECVNDGTGGPVSLPALQLAIRWCEFLEAHAARIYGAVIKPGPAAARALADRILNGQIPSPFHPRDFYRRGWRGLSSAEAMHAAIDVLVELHWLRPQTRKTSGRATQDYVINPKIKRRPTDKPDRTDKSPPGSHFSTESAR